MLVVTTELEKPLGIILEEVEENAASGVKVEDLSEGGSAYASPYADQLVGSKVTEVMGQDVTCMTFDEVMDCIIEAPSPIHISFEVEGEGDEGGGETTSPHQFEIGTEVEIQVLENDGEKVTINAKVGDNLRKSLLENKIEVYRGLKQKLGNCGGGGQCGFCAVDFVQSEGWSERSEYEAKKIGTKQSDNARLACLNNIQGPVTIRVL